MIHQPSTLAQQATDLNLKLMKWCMIPNLDLGGRHCIIHACAQLLIFCEYEWKGEVRVRENCDILSIHTGGDISMSTTYKHILYSPHTRYYSKS